MKIKMYEALNFLETYQELKDKELKIKTAYNLNKCFEECSKEQTFYQKKISELIQKYGKRNEKDELIYSDDKTSILIQEDKQTECNNSINELLNLDISIDDKYLLNINDLDIDITIDSLNKIKPFIKED